MIKGQKVTRWRARKRPKTGKKKKGKTNAGHHTVDLEKDIPRGVTKENEKKHGHRRKRYSHVSIWGHLRKCSEKDLKKLGAVFQ